ncbi:MAG: peptide chain release factor-like protein [Planctomycetales bacterium]|nr:peptide chain release factor-like protein [Planctomycetales bacterium]
MTDKVMTHPALRKIEQLRSECEIRFQRRSGPGGQHRNKVETAVILIHRPSGVRAEANERRSQAENLKVALRRLRVNLALDTRSNELAERPSEIWRERCTNQKIRISERHEDLGALLADCLDALHFHDWSVRDAAEWLGCSGSQLIKLLKIETRALQLTNQRRAESGLNPLK